MRSQTKRLRRPLTANELDSASAQGRLQGGNEMDNVVQKITLENVSLEERRREAKKPMYLVRYE
jgi:hypothetical protein